MRSFRSLASLLLVLAYLLAAAGGSAQDYVLCVGSNGHAAVEEAVLGRCGEGEPQAQVVAGHPGRHLPLIEKGHCGPCRDHTLKTEGALSRTPTHESGIGVAPQLLSLPAVGFQPWSAGSPGPTPSLTLASPPWASPTLTCLRTVILLI